MPPPRFTASTSGNARQHRRRRTSTSLRMFSSNSRELRPGADVRVQRDDGQLRRRPPAGAPPARVLVPDAVLRRRAAGVARLHVAVAEAGVDAHRDRPAVAGAAQLADHPGRADVGQHAVLEHDGERVVAEHVGGQHHHRRLGAHREARPARARSTSLPLTASIHSPAARTVSSTLRSTSSPSSRSGRPPACRRYPHPGRPACCRFARKMPAS